MAIPSQNFHVTLTGVHLTRDKFYAPAPTKWRIFRGIETRTFDLQVTKPILCHEATAARSKCEDKTEDKIHN